MNILPLVSAFIFLFALGSYTLIHHFKATMQEQNHYSASLNIQRKYAKKILKKKWKEIEGKNLHPKKNTESNKDENLQYFSPRDRLKFFPEKKLNIFFLFSENKDPFLEEVTLRLISNLYKRTTIYTENLPEKVLTAITRIIQADPSIDSFEKLAPKLLVEDHEFFYKIIKGTHDYILFSDKGYPALGDYLTITAHKKQKPIFFRRASTALLQALFKDPIAHQIRLAEKRKWEEKHKHNALLMKELETLLLQHKLNLSDYKPYLSFSRQKTGASQEALVDEKTGLHRKINTNCNK